MSSITGLNSVVYVAEEPHALATRVAARWGYPTDFGSTIRMPTAADCFATVVRVPDVDMFIRIDDVRQPRLSVLRRLHDAGGTVRIRAVTTCPTPWVWASAREFPGEVVRLRHRTFKDVSDEVAAHGYSVQLVPDEVSVESLLHGSEKGLVTVVLDEDEVPDWMKYRKDLGGLGDVTFGLVSAREARNPTYFWVGLRPTAESVGTLASALELIAEHGVSLDFLNSDQVSNESHRFFLGYPSDEAASRRMIEALAADGLQPVVLASIAEVT